MKKNKPNGGILMQAFQDNLKRLRKSRKLSQSDLAAKMNVTQQTVSFWETSGFPDVPTICLLSEILDVSLDELILDPVFYKEKNRKTYTITHELVPLLDESDKKQIRFLIEFLAYQKKRRS